MKTKLTDYWFYNEEIQIHNDFVKFVEKDLSPRTGIPAADFWSGLNRLINKFSKKNRELLLIRKELQQKINSWYLENQDSGNNPESYKHFLKNIGYLRDEGSNFDITTTNVDDEVARKASPQLVVPVDNSRFAINAVNARWGSLYDALYSTDVISPILKKSNFDHKRANQVIDWTRSLLDEMLPLKTQSWSKLTAIKIKNHKLQLHSKVGQVYLKSENFYRGYTNQGNDLYFMFIYLNYVCLSFYN